MSTVLTGLRDAQGRIIETLPFAVRQALMQADTILRLHGLQFELLCESCHARHGGPNDAGVQAEHSNADGSVSDLVCNCTRRRFLAL